MLQIGDKVKITLDPNLPQRYFAFQKLKVKGLEKDIVNISEMNGKIRQVAVTYAGQNCWFFPSELEKI